MNKPLYQLSAEYQRVLDKIEQADEITPELMDELNAVHEPFEDKVLSKTSIVKSFEAEAKSIKEAIEGMKDRIVKLEKKANRMREEIKIEMEKNKVDKAKNPYHEVRVMLNNPRLGDLDESLLPSIYFKEKFSKTVDRIALLNDLKEGNEVPGASIVRETRLQIR